MPTVGPDKPQEQYSSKQPIFIKVLVVIGVIFLFLTRPFIRLVGSILGKVAVSKWMRLTNKADSYSDRMDYNSAISLTEQALGFIEKKYGLNNYYCLLSLINLAEYQRLNAEFEKSEKNIMQVLEITEKESLVFHLAHIALAHLQADKQEYKKSEESFLIALEYFKADKHSGQYKVITDGLHSLYYETGQTDKARYYLEESR